jgi:small subunit ribosomal protein S1
LMDKLHPGEVLEVEVKRVVDFGAFVDLGGIDGLIPRTEVSWQRVNKLEDFLKVGDKIQAKVIEVNKGDGKITLSRRQTTLNPWDAATDKYPKGAIVEGEIVSITPYGAFVRLEEGLDGMIHISDMAWDSGGKRPTDYVAQGQRVQASVLNVDPAQKRISLGLKQLIADPWEGIEERYPQGARVKGRVTGLTKYGAFIEIEPGIEGMIHVSDFSWEKRINQPKDVVKKGDEVEACVLSIDRERRRISLGVKQMTQSPIELFLVNHSIGDAVEGEIVNLTDFGAFVRLADGVEGFIHVSQLDRNRVESPTSDFKVGEKIRAEILKVEREQGKISLSRRQLLKREERNVVKNYMRSGSQPATNTLLGELIAGLNLEDDLPKE